MKFFSTAQHPGPVIAASFTTKQDDYAPAGLRHGAIIRWNGAGTTGITGLSLAAGRVATIVNASTDYLLWLENQNTASAATNRFLLPDGFLALLMPGDSITVWKDGTTDRVRVLDWPTRGKAMGLSECEDFAGGSYGAFASGSNSGTVSSQYTGSASAPGYAGVSTSTSASSRPYIGGVNSIAKGGGPLLMVSRVQCNTALPNDTETYVGVTGFSSVASDTNQNAIAWGLRWNGSAAEWAQECIAAGVATRSTTGSPTPNAGGALVWLGVFVNAAGSRADFICSTDGVAFSLASSIASGLPTAQTSPVAIAAMKTAGTTARVMKCDLAGYRIGYTTARA